MEGTGDLEKVPSPLWATVSLCGQRRYSQDGPHGVTVRIKGGDLCTASAPQRHRGDAPAILTTLSRTLEKCFSPLGDISPGTFTPFLLIQIAPIF